MRTSNAKCVSFSPGIKVAIFILVLVFHEASSQIKCQCHLRSSALATIGLACKNGSGGTPVCRKDVRATMPEGYRYLDGLGLYKLHILGKNYENGQKTCETEGGRLVIPTSDAMASTLVSIFSKESRVVFAHIGINDLRTTGVYRGSDGNLAPWLNWLPGEPNHLDDGEHCVHFDAWKAMTDISCHGPHSFICERKLKAPVPQGYDFINDHGFYKIYKEKLTFHDAEAKCRADGGHLAVPETQREGEAIIHHVRTVGDTGALWVGISDEVAEGQFVTVHGTPLEDLEFDNWDTIEPNDGGGFRNEDCVTLQTSGALSDERCLLTSNFICELLI